MQKHVTDFLNANRPSSEDIDLWRCFAREIIVKFGCLAVRIIKKRETFLASLIYETRGRSDSEKLLAFAKGENFLHLCASPSCGNSVRFLGITRGWRKYCHPKCAWGDDNYKDKLQSTFVSRYGATSPLGSDLIKDKISKTNRERYGVSNPFGAKRIQEKISDTNKARLGVSNPAKSEFVKNKIKATCKTRFGTEYAFQAKLVRDKIITAWVRKYGVSNPMQHPEVLYRSIRNAKRHKTYVLPSGKSIWYQGYENIALDYLLQHYHEDDIFAERKVPTFKYGEDGNQRVYFPDIFVQSKNLIVEVKSSWTLKTKEQHQELGIKSRAVIRAGFSFLLLICSKTQILTIHNGEYNGQDKEADQL